MAGYSGTPLPKKLGIKEGSTVVLVAGTDVAVIFATERLELEGGFP